MARCHGHGDGGDQRVEELAERALPFVVEYLQGDGQRPEPLKESLPVCAERMIRAVGIGKGTDVIDQVRDRGGKVDARGAPGAVYLENLG